LSAARRIEAALAQGMADAGLPGLAAAARLPDGETVEVAVGVRGVDNPAPMTGDTLFWIASCTKALTATAAMLAIEDGLIGLDDPAGAVLPALAAPTVLKGFGADGAAVLVPATKPITLRRLLTHTSGFAYGFTSAALDRYATATGQNQMSADAPDFPLVFEPGEGWVYGIGIDWAGALIEAVTGETLDAYMQRRIFDPLGMADTSFFPSEAQKARTASMQARTPDGGLAPIPFAMPPAHYFSMGGGGLYSTPGDYLKFMESVLGVGPQILTPASLAALCGVECEGPDVGVLRTAQPHMSNDFDPFPGAAKTWGLGFVSNPQPGPHGRGKGSLAWAGLGNCYYWIDREAGAAGIICAQLLPFADAGALAAFADSQHSILIDMARQGVAQRRQVCADPGRLRQGFENEDGPPPADGLHRARQRPLLMTFDIQLQDSDLAVGRQQGVEGPDRGHFERAGVGRRLVFEVTGAAKHHPVAIARLQRHLAGVIAQAAQIEGDIGQPVQAHRQARATPVFTLRLERPDLGRRLGQRRQEVAEEGAGVDDVAAAAGLDHEGDGVGLPNLAGDHRLGREPMLGRHGDAVAAISVERGAKR